MLRASLLINRSIKSAASLAHGAFGLTRTSVDTLSIFAYHRVVADIEKAEKEAIFGIVISAASFRKHCELIRDRYDVVPLGTIPDHQKNAGKSSRPFAAITFDDGYLDFYDEAFPILRDLGLPATVFLPTDYIGRNKPLAHDRIFWLLKLALKNSVSVTNAIHRAGLAEAFCDRFARTVDLLQLTDMLVYLPNDRREEVIRNLENELGDLLEDYPAEYNLLTWDMVREMSCFGISFGGHTANHVILPLEDNLSAEAEIAASKRALEKELGANVVSFAYPNGEYNAAIREMTADSGFGLAVTTQRKVNRPDADLLALGRTSLCEESTRGISGLYSAGVAAVRLGV